MEVNFSEYDRSRKGFEFPWDITLRDTGALETAWRQIRATCYTVLTDASSTSRIGISSRTG